MKRNRIQTSIIFLLSVLLLAACQMARQPGPVGQVAAQPTAVIEPTATPLPRPTKTLVPSPTATQDPGKVQAELAENSVKEYFSALEKQDFEAAADLLSTFSLTVFGMTRGDVVSEFNHQRADGAAWSDLEIVDTKPFDDQTYLVHIKYNLAVKPAETKDAKADATPQTKESRDEQWAVRVEAGAWHCNWNNLIDFHTLDVDAQTLNGVTVKPVQANRFPDRIQLVMLVQNRTSAPVVFGQVNEILGTFYFGSQAIEAEKTQYVFNPLRSVPDFKLEVKGAFDAYPDSIEIRKWKTYNVTPWFTFQLN